MSSLGSKRKQSVPLLVTLYMHDILMRKLPHKFALHSVSLFDLDTRAWYLVFLFAVCHFHVQLGGGERGQVRRVGTRDTDTPGCSRQHR